MDDNKDQVTAEKFMAELGNIKAALEKNFDKKSAEQTKNFEDKIEVANETIKNLEEKIKNNAATEETVLELKRDFEIQTAAFDKLQTRMKTKAASSNGGATDFSETFLGKLADGIMELKSALHGDQIKGGKFIHPIQLKTVQDMTTATNLSPAGSIPNTYRAGIVPQPFELIHMRDIAAVVPSETDSYHFYRHLVGEGSIEFQTQELATKEQIDEDLLETTVNLNYLAGWLRISKKMLRNFKGLQGYLSMWLPERYYQREDTKAYQALISGATGVANTDTGGGMIRQIVRTIGLQKKAKYNVNGIVVDGAVWANMLTYTTTAGEYNNLSSLSITSTGQLLLLGIPIYVASWVGADEAIIGDWKYFNIIQSEGLSLQFFDQDGTNVRENKITARIEASVGFALLDPKAFAVASLESVS